MTDTQERVDINQITNNQRFGFSRRLLNSFIAREWFTYWVIAAVVVIGALYHHHSINSQEARFETTVEKMLDKREKKSRAFVEEAVKITETNMARKLETRFETVEKMLDEREKGSRAFIEAAVKTSETNMAGKFDMLRRLLAYRIHKTQTTKTQTSKNLCSTFQREPWFTRRRPTSRTGQTRYGS
ncbi:uncharacterized protein LOC111347151 isoform X2 [Stylophora pistillata]|uniref:uncharacterized protein LOC111347151 isoform X2 n=1 Tax=Stylophora pistillata TaxID=50429 RepID=UPI000C03FD5D|nr:uncharacterized protein LOC111347151 isoform X2 [Stylophora pistillata]